MRIILSKSTEEAVATVADHVIDQLRTKPSLVLGLATGKTMEPVYRVLTQRARDERLNLKDAFFFMLDEYVGLADNHGSSFKAYIEHFLITPLGLSTSQFAFPPVHAPSLSEAGAHYEQSLKESGGVDLQLLGIGSNGHVGFNEPGSPRTSRTRVVDLTPETIAANKSQFPGGRMPKTALSMGIGTILESRTLLMLATGKSKAEAIKYLLNHDDDPRCPATFMKNHPHFTLVLDPEAASKINLKI